jgi:hypothetical protein
MIHRHPRRPLPTRALAALVSLAALAALASGGCNDISIDQWPCPPGGTTITYESFGAGFFAEYCNSCHSAPDGQRNGAPDDYVFATHAEVVALRASIFANSAATNDAMPPGPEVIPLPVRDNLANWLACGAP